jgi:hypothetical protein
MTQAARRVIVASGVLVVAGCATPEEPFPDLPRLGVSSEFRVENLCDVGVSPRIVLTNVPVGTTQYVIQVTDTSVLITSPWQATVRAQSKDEIPEGAAKDYVGPCPGDMLRFPPLAPLGLQHRVEVLAEDQGGRPLAYGAALVNVQSAYLTAKRQRSQVEGGPASQGAPLPAPNLSSGFAPAGGMLQY